MKIRMCRLFTIYMKGKLHARKKQVGISKDLIILSVIILVLSFYFVGYKAGYSRAENDIHNFTDEELFAYLSNRYSAQEIIEGALTDREIHDYIMDYVPSQCSTPLQAVDFIGFDSSDLIWFLYEEGALDDFIEDMK